MTDYHQLAVAVDTINRWPFSKYYSPDAPALAKIQVLGWGYAYKLTWARIAYRPADEILRMSVYGLFTKETWSTFFGFREAHIPFTTDHSLLLTAFDSLRIFVPGR